MTDVFVPRKLYGLNWYTMIYRPLKEASSKCKIDRPVLHRSRKVVVAYPSRNFPSSAPCRDNMRVFSDLFHTCAGINYLIVCIILRVLYIFISSGYQRTLSLSVHEKKSTRRNKFSTTRVYIHTAIVINDLLYQNAG